MELSRHLSFRESLACLVQAPCCSYRIRPARQNHRFFYNYNSTVTPKRLIIYENEACTIRN